jgi:hypothetical protein
VGLEREARREGTLCEVDRGRRRAQVRHLVQRQRGQRGGLQQPAGRAARISQAGDRRIGLPPGGYRGITGAQQRDLELVARRPRWESLPGTPKDRRSLRCAAGEEEHAAELNRGSGHRTLIVTVRNELRQRCGRLRCAGPGARLAELEQDRIAVARTGRFVERAGKQRRGRGRVAQVQRVARGVAEQTLWVRAFVRAVCAPG